MRRVLVVYWWPDHVELRVAVEQHLRALDRGPDRVVYLNAFRRPPRWHRFETYDAVVLHTTFLALRWSHDLGRYRRAWSWLATLDCPKIALPQDEYDHAAILDEWLEELGVTAVFSNFDEQTRAPIYSRTPRRARFFDALTGYIDHGAAAYCSEHARPFGERPFDVVYRAMQLPFWFGSHGQLKHRIGVAVQERAAAHNLRTDVSTRPERTILGRAWLDFVMSGRATIGAESGSSVLDSRGEIQQRIRALLASEPSLTFEQVDARMPPGWDSYAFFAISPRHLEAVIARTCQLLVEGTYSGVLEPERHFIPLRRDFSNLDDALERIADTAHAEEIADRAYQEIYVDGTWTTDDFARRLREVFADEQPRPRRRRSIFFAATRAAEEAEAGLRRRAAAAVSARFPNALPQVALVSTRVRFAGAALRSAGRRPALATLLVRTLATGAWRGLIGRDLARDLLRLDLLDGFERHHAAGRADWRIRVEAEGDELRLVSVPRDGAVPAPESPQFVRSIVWDHSRYGARSPLDSAAPLDGLVGLGPTDRYEFAALSRLARLHPEAPWTDVVLRGRSRAL